MPTQRPIWSAPGQKAMVQYLHLHDTYTSLGYMQCKSDWSVYVRKSNITLTISATSIDNLLIASNSKTESNLAAMQINKKFAITDGADTEWLLACIIWWWRMHKLLMINQEQYTTQILLDFGMDNCNTIKTPCPMFHLTTAICPKTDDERQEAAKLPYCALIGKCIYLSNCMCPDILFAICDDIGLDQPGLALSLLPRNDSCCSS